MSEILSGSTQRWCRRCGQPVQLLGGDDAPGQLRKAVHTATGDELGEPDDHLAAPIDRREPAIAAMRR